MVKKLVWAASFLAAASPALAQTSPRELVEMTDFSGLAASPDGRWLLYRRERPSTVSGRVETGWYIVAGDGASPPRYLGEGGSASWNGTGLVEPGAAQWAPDSERFYIRARVGGAAGLWEGRPDGAFAPYLVGDADIERFAVSAAGALIYETGPSRAAIALTRRTLAWLSMRALNGMSRAPLRVIFACFVMTRLHDGPPRDSLPAFNPPWLRRSPLPLGKRTAPDRESTPNQRTDASNFAPFPSSSSRAS